MPLSVTQIVIFAFIPGAPEYLEKKSIKVKNKKVYRIIRNVKFARNGIFTGLALSAIAVLGLTFAQENSTTKYYSSRVLQLGGSLTALSAATLSHSILSIKKLS